MRHKNYQTSEYVIILSYVFFRLQNMSGMTLLKINDAFPWP